MIQIITESLIDELEHSLKFLLSGHKDKLNIAYDEALSDATAKRVKFPGFKIALTCVLYPGDTSDTIEATLGIRYLPQPARQDKVEIVHRANQEGLFTHKGEPATLSTEIAPHTCGPITGIKLNDLQTGKSVLLGTDSGGTV